MNTQERQALNDLLEKLNQAINVFVPHSMAFRLMDLKDELMEIIKEEYHILDEDEIEDE